MSNTIKSHNRSCRRIGSPAAVIALATVLLSGHATGETGALSRDSMAPTGAISDGISSSIRLMFTGSYRFQPPRPVDHSVIQSRILPPDARSVATLTVEKAAYIPHKLDFRVTPNALTIRSDPRPSIARIVPGKTPPTTPAEGRSARHSVTAALTRPAQPLEPVTRPPARDIAHAMAATETALDHNHAARERRAALSIVNRDIALATDLTRRFVLPGSGEPKAPSTAHVAALTKHLVGQPGMMSLPEDLAPADETITATGKAPASAGIISEGVVAALPSPNPRRAQIEARAKRKASWRRSQRARRSKRRKPAPVAAGIFDGGEFGPKWAQSFLSAN